MTLPLPVLGARRQDRALAPVPGVAGAPIAAPRRIAEPALQEHGRDGTTRTEVFMRADQRAFVAVLMHDIAALAADYDFSLSRGYVRRGTNIAIDLTARRRPGESATGPVTALGNTTHCLRRWHGGV